MEEIILVCENSLEGIFTGIYEAYAMRLSHEKLHIQVGEEDNFRLFSDYMNIIPDAGKTAKVANRLKTLMGEEGYLDICRAAASCQMDKGEAIYKTVVEAIRKKDGKGIMENLRNPHVMRVFELSRNTANEIHREIEFIRFSELQKGVLYSKIGPQNDVVPFVMPHFSDRLSIENFIIFDENHGVYGIHPAGREWFLARGEESAVVEQVGISEKEETYAELFSLFHDTIAIQQRRNYKLQRQMLPLRYREYMVEFTQKNHKI